MKKMRSSATNSNPEPDGAWIVQGVRFPAGSEFRANHKGKQYLGRVASGGFVLEGKRFNSPSGAAVEITKVSTNGWAFWKCKLPDSEAWIQLKGLRQVGERLGSSRRTSADDV
jgi:hypothetical protein